MKKLVTLTLAFGCLLVMATAALALPAPPTGYNWISAPVWTFTDLTTSNSQFEIKLENASFESDFGLFTVDNISSPTSITKLFQVFAYTDEENVEKTVTLRNNGGSFQIQLAGDSTWTDFSSNFGFYFAVHTGGSGDATADYEYYTFNGFNSPQSEQGVDHILTAFNPLTYQVRIYLDDQVTDGSDRDFDDMVVKGNDVAPVPEPGTLILLGGGLLGLGLYGRKRMKR